MNWLEVYQFMEEQYKYDDFILQQRKAYEYRQDMWRRMGNGDIYLKYGDFIVLIANNIIGE